MNRTRPTIAVAAVALGTVAWQLVAAHAAPAPAPAAAPATATTRTVSTRPAPAFAAHVVADRLVAPWALAFLPDGRALFTERDGKVRMIRDGTLVAEPVLVVPDLKAWVKLGLMGLALDPQFATNGFVYLAEGYGTSDERQSWVRVVRYAFRDDRLVEPRTLIDGIPAFRNHAGGRLAFGPDGKLYVTTGDADRPPLAQDLASLGGKVLRLNADGSVPADNPFAGSPSAERSIWSFGHRNAQGLAFHPTSGALIASEHGSNGGDEINRIVAGENYGWPRVSHDRREEGLTAPLAEFTPAVGPSAATFYGGEMFPELDGDLLVACLRGETVLRVRLDGAGERVEHVERLVHRAFGRLREVVVAPDGAIWVTTSEVDPPEGRNREGYDRIVRLTRGAGVADASALPAADAAPRPVGAVAVYGANCASCHGQTARAAMHSSLFDKRWQHGGTDDDLRRHIRDGIVDRGMPAYGGTLNREEIDELVRFVRIREEEAR